MTIQTAQSEKKLVVTLVSSWSAPALGRDHSSSHFVTIHVGHFGAGLVRVGRFVCRILQLTNKRPRKLRYLAMFLDV